MHHRHLHRPGLEHDVQLLSVGASVPVDMREAATVYRFSWWQRFRWVELPFSTIGLIWNSMMSMAGGWFFLATVEGLEIGGKEFWLPGIGSYIHAASTGTHWDWARHRPGRAGDGLMIVALDQLLWRPVVAWAKKFRVEEGGAQEETTSWFLELAAAVAADRLPWASRLGGRFRRHGEATEKAAETHARPWWIRRSSRRRWSGCRGGFSWSWWAC